MIQPSHVKMQDLQPGDVIIAAFPFTDRDLYKVRPAIILSTTEYIYEHGHIIAGMITQAAGSHWPTDLMIQDWQLAGLQIACALRAKIMTIEANMVYHYLGALSDRDWQAAQTLFASVLALA